MLSEGEDAPTVSLPAYVDGERRRVDLDEYIGEGIVVLAFYPADFNPACTMEASDLGDLDLFTMQKDISVFGVSPDSTYSHEAFAERYSLHVPLLSDGDRAAATAYDVTTETETGERLLQRAVFVVDHHGVVQYAWATDDLDAEIDIAPVKRVVGDIGGDDTAIERYRVGYDHYVEGREAFTAAMADYEEREWMAARNGFEDAEPAFTTAADHFDTAVRFAETDDFETVVDRSEEKADTLSHATSWLADSADAFASGRGKQGSQYREDAERLLDTAAELSEPSDPEAFTLTDDGVELGESVAVDPAGEDEGYDWRDGDGAAADTDLGVDDADLDAAVAADADDTDEPTVDGDTVEGDLEMDLDAGDSSASDGHPSGAGATGSDPLNRGGSAGGPSDGSENASEAGQSATSSAESGTPAAPVGSADVTDAADAADAADENDDDVEELDLADPTEGDDDTESDERADWDIPGR
jgi:peroxiredoxin